MTSKWPVATLSEVASIDYGTRVTRKRDGGSTYPVYGGGGATFNLDLWNRENCFIVSRFAMSEECVRYVEGKFFLNDSGLTVTTLDEDLLCQNFLDFFLLRQSENIYTLSRGTAQRNLDVPAFKAMAVPLPPLDEQKRIVAKLDEAMSDLNLIEQQTSEMGDLAALFTSAVSSEEFAVTSKWSSLPLRTVASIRPAKKEVLNRLVQEDEVTFMPMEDLPVKGGPVSGVRSKPLKEVYSSYTYFADNDVLLAKITPCFENGKIGVATNLHNGVGFGSSEFMVIRCGEQVDPYFLYYFLSQDSIVDAGSLVMTGSVGHRRVPQTFIENLQIPLPPLNEQKRIVAKLDEISKCSYMWKALQNRRTESRVKLKSAVLAAAFAGEL